MRHKRATEVVEYALDRYLAGLKGRGVALDSVRASTLATLASTTRRVVTTADMSLYLQQYRQVQDPSAGATKYVLACEGYGRNGRWQILFKPGARQASVQANRIQHAKFTANDMAARLTSDLVYEVRPGLRATSTDDDEIARVMTLVESQIAALIAFVEATLP